MAEPQPLSPAQVTESMASLALIWNGCAKHAADIAHARRRLFLAYVDEGFTDAQALELCKVMP